MKTQGRRPAVWAGAVFAVLAAATAAPVLADAVEPAVDLSLHTSRLPGLEVRFVDYHWQPALFAAMEQAPSAAAEPRRDWVLARVSIEPSPLKIDDVALPPGSYALSLFPNVDGKGMT